MKRIYFKGMNKNTRLIEDFNKTLRDSAVKHIKEKEKISPTVKAPYIMKYTAECDYFG